MGDLNTGLNEIDKSPNGDAFKLSENIRILRMDGKFTDTWRYLNPKTRACTWFTRRDDKDFNGFRLDYIWASSPLREGIRSAQHLHHVRGKVSDGASSGHAMVVADLAVSPMNRRCRSFHQLSGDSARPRSRRPGAESPERLPLCQPRPCGDRDHRERRNVWLCEFLPPPARPCMAAVLPGGTRMDRYCPVVAKD